ncbi:anthocyanidin 3-O-glucoside 2'''-O-xylosyltransferase [Coffea arabica]
MHMSFNTHKPKISCTSFFLIIRIRMSSSWEEMPRPEGKRLHVAMFPGLATGHMTPFLHLANELAKRGHKVSYLLTKKAKIQLECGNLYPDVVTFHVLPVPHVEGLPPGTENASEIPIFLNSLFALAFDNMSDQVEAALSDLNPDVVLYDTAFRITDFAPKIGFKTVCYNVVSAASIALALVPARQMPKDRPLTEEELMEPPPGYPSSSVVLRKHEAKVLAFMSSEFGARTFYDRIITALKGCHAIAIRSCQELEGQFCDYIGGQYQKPVFLSGPVLPEQEKQPLDGKWAEWLGKFEQKSVVFCAFGSQIILEKQQFQELVLGFELTGLPFFVALKPPLGTGSIEESLPDGFEERVGGRGVVYGGWVQQPQILSHPSVGCFVNHCGFGSMWESLMSDCQIVLVPHLGDQILNSRLLCGDLKVAVEVERDESGWFSKESLSSAINAVMGPDSEVGSSLRKSHLKVKEILSSPGYMSNYVESFIQNLYEL